MTSFTDEEEIEMIILGLVVDPVSNSPIVVLKVPDQEICLPIWIGVNEASSIASTLKEVVSPRPMTHDLLQNTIEILGAKVGRISIVELVENTFFAKIELRLGEEIRELDARPSDALALAVRLEVPIYVSVSVLDRAQATLVPVDASGNPSGTIGEFIAGDSEEEHMSKEEEFVTAISKGEENITKGRVVPFAELDKEQLSDMLADMDPDDFKYKM